MTEKEAIDIIERSRRQLETIRDNASVFYGESHERRGIRHMGAVIKAYELGVSALEEQLRRKYGCMLCRSVGRSDKNMNAAIIGKKGSKAEGQLYELERVNYCPSCGSPLKEYEEWSSQMKARSEKQ